MRIKTSDGDIVDIPPQHAQKMGFLESIQDMCGDDDDASEVPVSSKNLRAVLAFADTEDALPVPFSEHSIPVPLRGKPFRDVVPLPIFNYFEGISMEQLMDLLNVTNYLYYRKMYTTTAAKIASEFVHLTVMEMRSVLGISNPGFTAEEDRKNEEELKYTVDAMEEDN